MIAPAFTPFQTADHEPTAATVAVQTDSDRPSSEPTRPRPLTGVMRTLIRHRAIEESPAGRALVELAASANRVIELAGVFCDEHGGGCACPFCEFVRDGRYADILGEAFVVLRANVNAGISMIESHLPPSFCDPDFRLTGEEFAARLGFDPQFADRLAALGAADDGADGDAGDE